MVVNKNTQAQIAEEVEDSICCCVMMSVDKGSKVSDHAGGVRHGARSVDEQQCACCSQTVAGELMLCRL